VLASACVVNAVAQGLIVGVNARAYLRYYADPRLAGFLFGASAPER
jgi:hypothetical protein